MDIIYYLLRGADVINVINAPQKTQSQVNIFRVSTLYSTIIDQYSHWLSAQFQGVSKEGYFHKLIILSTFIHLMLDV